MLDCPQIISFNIFISIHHYHRTLSPSATYLEIIPFRAFSCLFVPFCALTCPKGKAGLCKGCILQYRLAVSQKYSLMRGKGLMNEIPGCGFTKQERSRPVGWFNKEKTLVQIPAGVVAITSGGILKAGGIVQFDII